MSHRSNAADIYARIMLMLDNLVVNDTADQRAKVVECIKNNMSDYSWERYAAGRDDEKLESIDPRAAYEAGRRAYCPASILTDAERAEREWFKAQTELKKMVETSR